ncbi:ATP-binding protein [Moraxellaceae bacterium AER2_44_116]|nr:ATP-binding protein [Moraxellaceae bacterium AER2_44_116]
MVKMKDIGLNISALSLEGFSITGFRQKESDKFDINKLSRVNILIGKNNSGKSRLIRELFKGYIDNLDDSIIPLEKTRENIISSFSKFFKENALNTSLLVPNFNFNSSITEHLSNFNTYSQKFFRSFEHNNIPSFFEKFDKIDERERIYIHNLWKKYIDDVYMKNIYPPLERIINTISQDTTKIYIPMLRGLRHLDTEKTNFYFNQSLSDYFLGEQNSNSYNIQYYTKKDKKKLFTGLEIYQILQEKLLGMPDERLQVKKYETFLSVNFFNHQEVTLIPFIKKDEKDKCIHIKIGNEDQFPIYHLGDGLQTIIIVTFPIFMAEHPSLFFIEEPDLAMHPSMQRALIQAMLDKKEHQYFLTTHSNHFLDMALESDDISIFQVQKEIEDGKAKFKITHATAILKSVFEDLGIRNSSVLLANCTIWVEGVTDKLYLKAYMKKYLQELSLEDTKKFKKYDLYKEDLHYIFAEYQGSNIMHWNFSDDDDNNPKTTNIKCFCGTAFLLADGDIRSKKNQNEGLTRDKILESIFDKGHLEILEQKEIENYIPIEIVKMTVDNMWNSFNNDTIGLTLDDSAIDNEYFKSEGVGNYLESLIKPTGTKNRFFFAETSGTIKNKVKFCEISINFMNTQQDWKLTKELTQLCEKVFQYIASNNPA